MSELGEKHEQSAKVVITSEGEIREKLRPGRRFSPIDRRSQTNKKFIDTKSFFANFS